MKIFAVAAVGLLAALAPVMADEGSPATHGKIVVYRPASIVGAMVGCPIRIEGKEVAELGRGKYVELDVPAGRTVLTNKISSVEVSVEPGETRYVRCKIGMGLLAGGAHLQIVDKADFDEAADHLERKAPEQE